MPERRKPQTVVKAQAAPPVPELQLPPYRPITRRRRWLIVLLTLATVALIGVEMLKPHMQLMNAKAARADAAKLAACPPGAASVAAGCPGSTMPVLMLPVDQAHTGR
jgi:hypothetical protein